MAQIKSYLSIELKRLFRFYSVHYHYTGGKSFCINRQQILPPLCFKFDDLHYYVYVNHLPESDFDPFSYRCIILVPSESLTRLFLKLLKFKLISNGTFHSYRIFEQFRSINRNKHTGVEKPVKNCKGLPTVTVPVPALDSRAEFASSASKGR